MNPVRVYLYSCQYGATLSIVIAANGIEQARACFEQFLAEHKAWPKGQPVDHARMYVKKRDESRPIYTYG